MAGGEQALHWTPPSDYWQYQTRSSQWGESYASHQAPSPSTRQCWRRYGAQQMAHTQEQELVVAKREWCSLEIRFIYSILRLFATFYTCNCAHISMVVDGPSIQSKANKVRLLLFKVLLDGRLPLGIYLGKNSHLYSLASMLGPHVCGHSRIWGFPWGAPILAPPDQLVAVKASYQSEVA